MLKNLIHKSLQIQAQKAAQTLNSDDLRISTWLATIEKNLTKDQAQLSSKNIITNDIIQLCKFNIFKFEHAAHESDQTLCKVFVQEYQTDFAFDGADPTVRLQQIIKIYFKELGFNYSKEGKDQKIKYYFDCKGFRFKLNDDLWELIPSYIKDTKFSRNNEQLRSAIDNMSDEQIRNNIRLLVIKRLKLNLNKVYSKKITTLMQNIKPNDIGKFNQKDIQKLINLIPIYNEIKRFIYKYNDGHDNIDNFYYDEAYLNTQTNEVIIRIGNYVKFIDNDNLKQHKFLQLYGTRFVKAVKNYYEKMTSSDYYTEYDFHSIDFEKFVFASLNKINWVKARESTNNYYVEV